jgi:phosphatidylglycerol:prolipoprotein diacylglycerol transferase
MHPILFEIPTPGLPWGDSLPIYSYGVMLGTSMIVAWYIVMWLGEREGVSRDTLANAFIATAVSSIVGARLLYVITNPDEFESFGDLLALRRGGLVAYGGFLGGYFGALAFAAITKKMRLMSWADVVAPTLALGLTLTRVGCYLYGCDFGARLGDDAPSWLRAIGTFPHWHDGPVRDAGSPAWSHHVATYDLPFDASSSYPVHPTQLYESLAGVALLAVTLLVWRHRQFRGHVVTVLAMAYGVWRFAIEYVRDDPERGEAFGFSTSQLISLAIIPVAALFYLHFRKQQRDAPVAVMRLGDPSSYVFVPAGPAGEPVSPSEPAPSDAAAAVTRGARPAKKRKKKR